MNIIKRVEEREEGGGESFSLPRTALSFRDDVYWLGLLQMTVYCLEFFLNGALSL